MFPEVKILDFPLHCNKYEHIVHSGTIEYPTVSSATCAINVHGASSGESGRM
jgi:hypothetical protein